MRSSHPHVFVHPHCPWHRGSWARGQRCTQCPHNSDLRLSHGIQSVWRREGSRILHLAQRLSPPVLCVESRGKDPLGLWNLSCPFAQAESQEVDNQESEGEWTSLFLPRGEGPGSSALWIPSWHHCLLEVLECNRGWDRHTSMTVLVHAFSERLWNITCS